MDEIRGLLKDCIAECSTFTELRYHDRETGSVTVEKGKLENSSIQKRGGISVRTLYGGTWGFSSTAELSKKSITSSIYSAIQAAKVAATIRKVKIPKLPPVEFKNGLFQLPAVSSLKKISLEEKIQLVMETEHSTRKNHPDISTVSCSYSEIFENKCIITTDGADVMTSIVRPEFRINAVAKDHGEMQSGSESIGVTGDWDCLFKSKKPAELGDRACQTAIDLLKSSLPEGGEFVVILSPSLVGLLVHEAIGHTVEADFVLAGSVAAGKIGQRVGSDLVTICDSGKSEYIDGAGGSIEVDDEGIAAKRTVIIQNGILTSYLHNRETAAHFGVSPTGSARAWSFSDFPLIRMRNTYLEPGQNTLEEMIQSTQNGFFLEGPKGGQADSTGEFMFGIQKAYRIKNGKLGGLVKGVTVSGIAFDVLNNVDMVSKEFQWDLGSGYCGKGQPAKVDAGGPFIRTKIRLGGVIN